LVYLGNQPPWFTFIVHPRDLPDLMATMPGSSLIRKHSASDQEFVDKVSTNPPVVLHDVIFGGSAMRGEIIGIPLLPDAVLTPDGHRAVIDAVRLGVQRGAHFIGLGALSSPATAGGRSVLRHVPPTVTVTNGNGLTAAVARDNVHEVCAGRAREATRVALLGATGSVGAALSHLLADDGFDLVLVGSSLERVTKILGDLAERATLAGSLEALGDADVVVALTNDEAAKLRPEVLKPGCVVVDVAQPPNVEHEQKGDFAERGVSVVVGGAVRIPGYSCQQDFRLPDRGQTFACLAETYLLTRESVRRHSVGRPSAEYARHIGELARRHGVSACTLGVEVASAEAAGDSDAMLSLST
jgi:predicted amino acid dehydrogenase